MRGFAMDPRLDTDGWLALTGLHFCISPDRDSHLARYAGLCPAQRREKSWLVRLKSLPMENAPLHHHYPTKFFHGVLLQLPDALRRYLIAIGQFS
uniref:Uncharacterized protein n=1 Tax=Candidatus Kentrum sp. LFY TaxID=2126342 RepID=A0A450WJ31_9GAMM|nr:MAG: hypothetical protein BECKLFY1418C_GA0070996_102828 [Candidatus Kentron sp. LFY]